MQDENQEPQKVELPDDEWIYKQADKFIAHRGVTDALERVTHREAFRTGIIIYWNKLNGTLGDLEEK